MALPSMARFSKAGIINHRKLKRTAEDLLKRVNLRPFQLDRQIKLFSGGNQQKAIIARWLAAGSRILLFDEPTRGIDVGAKFDIYALLGELTRQGKALVVVSSDLRELMLICDRIGVLSAGRLIDTFERDSWTQDDLLAAAFAGYQKRDALLNEAAPRDFS
jgi:ribose transport system ATP-binding protein